MLIKLFQKGMKNQLISGSFIMLSGTSIANLFNFLFNLFMSRNLSVTEYGILASLLSLMMIPGLFSGSVVPAVVNFAATYFARNQLDLVRGLFLQVGKVSFGFGLLSFFIFVFFSQQIGDFFQINNTFLILSIGVIVLLGFLSTINLALLQAKLAFQYLTFINIFSSFLKLLIGTVLVLFGFAVGGAILGIFLSGLISYLFSFFPLRDVFYSKIKKSKINYSEIIQYGGPAALIFFSLSAFTTMDIVLVKHFFHPKDAGLYAGLSLIGRVIFFLSAPISTVVFPLVTQKHVRKESYKTTALLAFVIVLVPSIGLTVFYFMFPEFVIAFFLKKEEYFAISQYLGFFAIYITLYSMLYIMCNILLSIKKTKIFLPLILGALLQTAFIFVFHKNFFDIISVSLAIVSLLLFLFLLYYVKFTYFSQPILSHEKE